jgi:hypothetical protein
MSADKDMRALFHRRSSAAIFVPAAVETFEDSSFGSVA